MIMCFQHKKPSDECGCHRATVAYSRALKVIHRKSAMEAYYATQAFSENLTYSPEAVKVLSHSYLTVADILSDFLLGPNPTPETTVEWLVKAKKMLQEAGFTFEVESP